VQPEPDSLNQLQFCTTWLPEIVVPEASKATCSKQMTQRGNYVPLGQMYRRGFSVARRKRLLRALHV